MFKLQNIVASNDKVLGKISVSLWKVSGSNTYMSGLDRLSHESIRLSRFLVCHDTIISMKNGSNGTDKSLYWFDM